MTLLPIAIAIAATLGLAALARHDAPSDPAPLDPPRAITLEQARALIARGTPGPMHQLLATRAGRWTLEIRTTNPSDPAQTAVGQGEATSTMLHGGRQLRTEMVGSILGQPFAAMAIDAFNTTTGRFQTVWIDSGSTSMAIATGDYDPAARTITFSDPDDPRARSVWTVIDDATLRFEMIVPGAGGQPVAALSITFRRNATPENP